MPDRSPLLQDVQFLKGVGPSRAQLLAKLGIRNLEDLLFYFPRGYDDLSDIRSISELTAGTLQTVQGEVVEMQGKELPGGKSLVSIILADQNNRILEGVWFNQPYISNHYRFGQRLAFSGKPRWYQGHWQINNPRVQLLDGGGSEPDAKVVPIYPLTEGLYADALRKAIRQAVDLGAKEVAEFLPDDLRRMRDLPHITQAIQHLHFPQTIAQATSARRRFVYEEFLTLQVGLALRRRDLRDRQRAPKLPTTATIDAHIRRLFPFKLTEDQDKAVSAIGRDLAKDRPMQRLLQADVGAGKTAVAVYALLFCVANKHLAVLMAPTEVLARQHWRTIDRYLEKSRVRRQLLTGSVIPKERKRILADLKEGNLDLVVGTQALIQKDVEFANLGLVVIDEQHKFGVTQRARMKKLGVDPHYLVMTATPIPRTVALTVFGDLDVTTMKQLPPGRQPVTTRWATEAQRDRVYDRLRVEMKRGRQTYFVCPLVEESEKLDLKAAQQTYEELRDGSFKDYRVGLLHGRMDDEEKDSVMQQFRCREIDLLVTTLVIEVGVDVANATLMVIEHADRFGLSQLHQLRGRVSRGKVAGECYVFSTAASDEARQRLRVFTKTTNGFTLAEEDAKLRGLGEFFGTRQHGLGELRVANLMSDRSLLELARSDALDLVSRDAGLKQPEHAALRRAVIERYGATLELAEIG